MTISRYQSGFTAGVAIRERLRHQAMARTNLYVGANSTPLKGEKGASDGNTGTYLAPYATVDYAIGKAKEGDVIWVRPNYTETMLVAGQWACDVAGIMIMGLGTGASRPTLTFNSTANDGTSSVLITADSVAISNIIGVSGEDANDNPFHVQAADCLLDIETHDGSTSLEATYWIKGTDAADRLTVNAVHDGFTGGSGQTAYILLDGSIGGEIDLNYFGLATTAIVHFNDTAVVDVNVRGYFYNYGTTDLSLNIIDTPGTSTWSIKGFDGAAGQSFEGSSGNAVAAGDLSVIASDVVSIGSDLKITKSDVEHIASNLIFVQSDLVAIASNLLITKSDVEHIASNLVFVQSDVVAIGSNLNITKSDVEHIASNLVFVQSDVLHIASNLVFVQSDLVAITSNLVITKSDVEHIASNLIFVQSDLVAITSNLLITKSDVEHIASNLILVQSDLVAVASNLNLVTPAAERTVVATGVDLTSGTVSDVFTIGNGPIIITNLFAVVTTVCSSHGSKMAFVYDPTQGSNDIDISLSGASVVAGLDLNGAAIYSVISGQLDATIAVLTLPSASALGSFTPAGNKMFVPAGGIDIDMSTSSLATGALSVYMTYIPTAANVTVA